MVVIVSAVQFLIYNA